MKPCAALLLAVLAPCVCGVLAVLSAAPTSVGDERVPIYIAHVTVIDTETGRELHDQTVVISGDRVAEVKKSQQVKLAAAAKIVDGSGKFLIPGLWDMHVHALYADRLDIMFPMFVANGVLGIRDMGSGTPLPEIDRYRREIASGERPGPRIIAAGPILDGRPKPARATFLSIATPQEGREAVRSLKASGADLIKIYSWLSRDSFLAIADEAKKQGISVSGHVPFSVSALEASDAGMKSLEHLFGIYLSCSSREEQLRSEMLKGGVNLSPSDRVRIEVSEAVASYDESKARKVFAHLARNRTWASSTYPAVLANSEVFNAAVTSDSRLKYIPIAVQKQWSAAAQAGAAATLGEATVRPRGTEGVGNLVNAQTLDKMLRIGAAVYRAGVPMLAGSDTAWLQPYTYAGFSMHDELALLVRAGLTPLEALRTAVINPALYLGLQNDFGPIAKGKLANMVLLDADPLIDIHSTRRISAVFLAGRYFDRSALDRMLNDAEIAANPSRR